MAGLDYLWLSMVVNKFFFGEIGHLARVKDGGFDIIYWPAVLTYILMIVGLMVFVYPLAKGDPMKALGLGALFGGILFGVYEGTNMAFLRDWTMKMMVVDTLWGAFLCGVTAGVVVYFTA